MHIHGKFWRFGTIAAVAVLTVIVNSGAGDAASRKTGSCLSDPSERCVLDILVRQGSPTDEIVEMLALAGRANAAKRAAAKLGPEVRKLVEAIGFARAGDLAKSLAVAGKIKTEGRDAALGNIALALARRGDIDKALGIAAKVSTTETKASFLWRIARVMARTGKTNKLGHTINRAVRADPGTEKKVMPVLLALVKGGASNEVGDLILRPRGDGKPWTILIIEDAINMLIAHGKKDAARRILVTFEKRIEAGKKLDRKMLLNLLVRSYAALRDPRSPRTLYNRFKKEIDPGFLLIQLARSGDSLTALAALLVASEGTKLARSGDRQHNQMYIRKIRVQVAIGIYASGDRRGAQKFANKIDASLPLRGSKAWKEDILYVRIPLLAGTGRVGEALQLAEQQKLKTVSLETLLAWYVLPSVAASRDTAGMLRFLNFLARTRAIRIDDSYDFRLFCDTIARKSWAGNLDKSRAVASALLRASLADTKSTEWDHEGVAKCQLWGGDYGGAIETVRAIKDRDDRQLILLDILKHHL